MARITRILAAVIAIGFGLITLAGLLVGDGLGFLSAFVGALRVRDLTSLFLQLVLITVAVTVLIGVVNLLLVHLRRVRRRSGGWGYSIVLIVGALAVIALTALERAGVLTGDPPLTRLLLEDIQVSIESALAALLLFALVYGAVRATRRQRFSGWTLLFTAALLVALAGALSLPGLGLLADLRGWLLAVPVSAGARGILLGIALATVVAGVRVLIGQDRSYRE